MNKEPVQIELTDEMQEAIFASQRRQNKTLRCCVAFMGSYLFFLALYFVGCFCFDIWGPTAALFQLIMANIVAVIQCIIIWMKKW